MRDIMRNILKIKMNWGKAAAAGAVAAMLGCSPAVLDSFSNIDEELSSCGLSATQLENNPDMLGPLLEQTNASKARLLSKNVAAPWSSGRQLEVRGDTIYIADRDNGDVVLMDRQTMKVTKKVAIGGGPEQLVVDKDGAVWVTLRHAGQVARIVSGEVNGKFNVGTEPIGLAMSPGAEFVFVAAAADNKLVVLDAESGAVLHEKSVGERPRAVSVTQAGGTKVRVVIGHQNPINQKISTFSTTAHGVTSMEYDANKVSSSIGGGIAKFAFAQGPRNVSLRVANPGHGPDTNSKFRVTQGRTGLHAVRVSGSAVNPETGHVVVSHMLASPGDENTTKAQAFGSKTKKASSGYGSSGSAEKICNSTPVRPMEPTASVIGDSAVTTGRAENTTAEFPVRHMHTGRSMLAVFDQPSGISFHPKATLAFMPSVGTDNVLVLNTGDGDMMKNPLAEIRVGQAPVAVAFSDDGNKAYVLNGFDWTVSEIDLTGLLSKAVVQSSSYKDSLSTHKLAGAPQLAEPLTILAENKLNRTAKFGTDPLPEQLRMGRRLFHWTANPKLAKSGRFACASCHFEGSEDKQVWHIADGPRQTPALAGRLQGTGPFNWVGSEHELQNNMDKTIKRMGGEGLNGTELAALEQFMVHGLAEPPNPHRKAKLTADEEAGKKLFFDPVVACGSCHSGADSTDGQLWDVGTATSLERQIAQVRDGKKTVKFNTPSLRGVWSTGPYLHDGSARTLMDVLNRTAGKMGNVKGLSVKQKEQLVAYMKTL